MKVILTLYYSGELFVIDLKGRTAPEVNWPSIHLRHSITYVTAQLTSPALPAMKSLQ